jgi:hypothetical protein
MDIPFKEGDIIVFDEYWIIIYAGLKEENKAIKYYAVSVMEDGYLNIRQSVSTGIGCYREDRNARYATMEETHAFFEKIEKRGYRWNSGELKFENI